jgi:type II secretion system protein I
MMSRIGSRFRLSQANTKRAFTLVELLVSISILGFALVIIIQSYAASLSGLNISENYINASGIARDKIAQVELLALESGGLDVYGEQSGIERLNGRDFSWSYEVKEIDDNENLSKNLAQVCLRVSWKERGLDKDVFSAAYLPKKKE